MAFTEQWIPMGPCELFYQKGADTVTIQKTGDVVLSETEGKADIVYQQDGTQPADRMSQGMAISVLVPIAKGDWADFKKIDPNLREAGTTPNERLERIDRVGQLDSGVLAILILKPYENGVPTTDKKKHYFFPAVAAMIEGDKTFNAAGQRFYTVRFWVYKDASGVFYKKDPVYT